MLTEEHKSKRMAASLENLCCYQDEGETFVERIIMGDETWVYEFTPQSKRKSMTWQTFSFTHYKKNPKLSLLQKKNSYHVLGL
jgi:hypothetical protein